MDTGSTLIILALSYALGVFWYDLIPGKWAKSILRVGAYPFLGIVAAEAFMTPLLGIGPTFGGWHLFAAVIGSFLGVAVDWFISYLRPPMTGAEPELINSRRAA